MKAVGCAVALLGLALALGACKLPKLPHAKSCIHRKIHWTQVHTVTTKLNDRLYFLRTQGSGLVVGNMTVLAGPEGVLLVDTGYQQTAGRIQAAIRAITPAPLRYAINTHWHGDHSCGNAAMHRAGAAIIGQDEERTRVAKGSDWTPGPGPDGVPQVTYQETMKLHLNGEEVELFHPHNAHTAGDTVVFFKTSNVVASGDVFVNGGYPYSPTTAVSGVTGAIAGLELLLTMIDDKTVIVPGHGPIAHRADVVASLAMMKDAQARIAALKAQGITLEALKTLDPLKDLDAKWGPPNSVNTGRDLAEWIYTDLSRTPEPEPAKQDGGG